MPCNTGHAYLDDIRAAVDVPVVDMIAETARATPAARIGLLATDGTIESGLYHRAFGGRGIDVVVPGPDDQRAVMAAIAAIKAGEPLPPLEERLTAVVERLVAAGAEASIAACTELSLLSGSRMPARWIDALDVLVRSTLRAAGVQTEEREESA
jgi:aspartate racemase